MLCPICNLELNVISGGEINIVPTYSEDNSTPAYIVASTEIVYSCPTCNLILRIPETTKYIPEVQ